jgi:hypothetical protein
LLRFLRLLLPLLPLRLSLRLLLLPWLLLFAALTFCRMLP